MRGSWPISCASFCAAALLAAALGTVVLGCGASQAPTLTYGESARRDYERALAAFSDHDCLTAEPLFNNIVREYSYSRYAALAELRAADCEQQQQHYTEAIRRYRAFIRARPTHAEIDYANFQIAVSYYRQIPQDFFLSPPREERDQAPTRSSLRIIQRFLRDYPESEHVAEAETMQREILALLARHELFVADFYLIRDRPRATVNRLERLLEDYQGSGLEPQALLLLGRTFLHMRERPRARTSFEDLIARFPDTGYALQARNYLDMMGGAQVDAGEPPIVEGDAEGGDDEEEELEGDPDAEGDDVTDEEREAHEQQRLERERREDAEADAEIQRREEARERQQQQQTQPPSGGSGSGSTPY